MDFRLINRRGVSFQFSRKALLTVVTLFVVFAICTVVFGFVALKSTRQVAQLEKDLAMANFNVELANSQVNMITQDMEELEDSVVSLEEKTTAVSEQVTEIQEEVTGEE